MKGEFKFQCILRTACVLKVGKENVTSILCNAQKGRVERKLLYPALANSYAATTSRPANVIQ